MRPQVSFVAYWWLSVGLIFFARLWLIATLGSPLPFWDQWDAQANSLFMPWLDGTFSWSWDTLFAPHNEHRIALSRLWVMGLFALNQQWDPLVEMTANNMIHTVNAGLLILLLRRQFTDQETRILGGFVVLLWIIPFGWENTLAGFQSQFYFMFLLGMLTLWGMLLHPLNSRFWWLGVIAACIAPFSLASGFLATLMVMVMSAGFVVLDRAQRVKHSVNVVVALVLLDFAIGLLHWVAGHEGLKAHTLQDFMQALGAALAWPWVIFPGLGVVLYLPLLGLVGWALVQRKLSDGKIVWIISLGGWVLLQAAAMAYSRGAGGAVPASRYTDILALGLIVNVAAWLIVTKHAPQSLSALRYARQGWFSLVLVGLLVCPFTNIIPVLHEKYQFNLIQQQNVRQYQQSQDLIAMRQLPLLHLPHPIADNLAVWLSHPKLRHYFAAEIQYPQPLPVDSTQFPAFTRNGFYPTTQQYRGEDVIGSYTAEGNAAMGGYTSPWLQPLPQAYLQIPVSGYLGQAGLFLTLETQAGKIIPIQPATLIRESWHLVTIKNPGVDYRLVAKDENPHFWIAFGAPRGMGILSYYNHRLLDVAFMVLLGLLLIRVFLILLEHEKDTAK